MEDLIFIFGLMIYKHNEILLLEKKVKKNKLDFSQ